MLTSNHTIKRGVRGDPSGPSAASTSAPALGRLVGRLGVVGLSWCCGLKLTGWDDVVLLSALVGEHVGPERGQLSHTSSPEASRGHHAAPDVVHDEVGRLGGAAPIVVEGR